MSDMQLTDDGDLRKYRTELPNLVDDIGLSVYAFRLYAHFKRVCGSSNGVCFQGSSTIAKHCKMSVGKVSESKVELVKAGLITIEPGDVKKSQADRVYILDVWAENMKRYSKGNAPGGGNGQGTGGVVPPSPHERVADTPSPDEDPLSPHESPPSCGEAPLSPHEPKKNSLKKELFKNEPDKNKRVGGTPCAPGLEDFAPAAPQPKEQSSFNWQAEPSQANGPAHLLWQIMVNNGAPYPKTTYGMELRAAKELLELYSPEEILFYYKQQSARRNGYTLGYLSRDIVSLVGKSGGSFGPTSGGLAGNYERALADIQADRQRLQ
jgi:hypothetical protein